VQGPQGDIQKGKRLMIIQLGEYNETDALLMDATGSQGHVCYQDGDQDIPVTTVAVHMGKEGTEA